MDVRFYKYNDADYSLTALGTVDNYQSFMFTRSFTGIGSWKMIISGTTANAQRVKNADFIAVTDGVAGLITDFSEEIDEKGITYIFSGVELKGLAQKRIVMPPDGEAYLTYTNKSPEEVIAGLISTQLITSRDERKFNGSIAGYYIGDERITYNGRFSSLSNDIVELAETYAIGWYADIQEDNIVWHIVHGVNRTEKQSENARFVLSYGRDTLQSSTLQKTNTLPNVALVAGQGEGIDRAIAYIGDSSGLDRGEVYIDARDLADANALPARGRQKLAEYGDAVVFDVTLAPVMAQQYKKSFDLGDIGTVKADSFAADCALSEVTEVYEGGALLRIDTVFGYDKQTIAAAIKRLNSNADTLVKTEGSTTGGGSSGSGGGLTDYEGLFNKPKINGTELVGDKSLETLGIAKEKHTHVKSEILDMPTKLSEFENDKEFVTKDDIPQTGEIPTKLGELENDVGFITKDDIPEPEGGVTSFRGRKGDVAPQKGDYTADMVGAISLEVLTEAIQDAIYKSWGAAY